MRACSRRRSRRATAVASMLALVSACGGGDDVANSEVSSTTLPRTSVPPGTVPTTTPSPTTADAPPTSPADTGDPTTTVGQPSCDDDVDAMLAVVDDSIERARLAPGGTWSEAGDGSTFDDRTHPAEEFRYRMGLDCSVRLVQRTGAGDERLVVAAWTGDRRAWVTQATDAPSSPYRSDQRVQLFIDQPEGEWLVDQSVWAGSLQTGETVIVGVVDTAFGVAAKSWWNEVPRFEDLEVTNESERYAIDTLVAASARNVSVAEPADFQSEIAAIQFITPLGLHLIATVAPPEWFDPAAPIVEGETTVEDIAGVDVYVTTAVPDSYAVGSVGWTCGDHVWFIDSAYGTVDELTDWTAHLIESAGC